MMWCGKLAAGSVALLIPLARPGWGLACVVVGVLALDTAGVL